MEQELIYVQYHDGSSTTMLRSNGTYKRLHNYLLKGCNVLYAMKTVRLIKPKVPLTEYYFQENNMENRKEFAEGNRRDRPQEDEYDKWWTINEFPKALQFYIKHNGVQKAA